jgi:hypothetical protein
MSKSKLQLALAAIQRSNPNKSKNIFDDIDVLAVLHAIPAGTPLLQYHTLMVMCVLWNVNRMHKRRRGGNCQCVLCTHLWDNQGEYTTDDCGEVRIIETIDRMIDRDRIYVVVDHS